MREGNGEHNNGASCKRFLREEEMNSTIMEQAARGFCE